MLFLSCIGPPLLTFKFSPKFPFVIFVFPLIRFPLPTYSLFPLTLTSHSFRTRTLSKFLPPSTPSPLSKALQFQLLHQVTPFPQLHFLLRFFFPKICFPLSKPSLFFSLSLHSHRPSSPTSATGIFDGESCGSVGFLGLILRCCEWVGWGFDVVFEVDTLVLRGGEGVVSFEEWECGFEVAKEEQLGVKVLFFSHGSQTLFFGNDLDWYWVFTIKALVFLFSFLCQCLVVEKNDSKRKKKFKFEALWCLGPLGTKK